jgi:putative NADH-flavin reductase
MRVTVFGATGRTGVLFVHRALQAGNEVVAVARRPDAVTLKSPLLRVVEGDVLLGTGIPPDFVCGSDAVVSALGANAGDDSTKIYSKGATTILAAMRAASVTRLLVISAIPVVEESSKSRLERTVLHPLLWGFFGKSYEDMLLMENELKTSGSDWTVFRPPRLTDAATDEYRMAVGGRLERARSISRSGLARAMLDSISDTGLCRRIVEVAR